MSKPVEVTEDLLQTIILGADEDGIYGHVGYFIASFSLVELAITVILAIISKSDDWDAFHTLTRGMDARVKIERLRILCRKDNLIKSNSRFDTRLLHVSGHLSRIRNNLAHSALVPTGKAKPGIAISNIGRIPFEASGIKRKFGARPDEITLQEIFRHSVWMEAFASDLGEVVQAARNGSVLEIKKPRSMEPKAFLQSLHHTTDRAKPRRP